MNLQRKIAKKAFKEIKAIQNAPNMVVVDYAISTALLKIFNLQQSALIKIAMEKGNSRLVKEYGYSGKIKDFGLFKAINEFNLSFYGDEAKKYLLSFTPERMQKSEMYKKFGNGYVWPQY